MSESSIVEYTVVVLLPDCFWSGPMADAAESRKIIAVTPDDAALQARQMAANFHEIDQDDVEVLAVFAGHHDDLHES